MFTPGVVEEGLTLQVADRIGVGVAIGVVIGVAVGVGVFVGNAPVINALVGVGIGVYVGVGGIGVGVGAATTKVVRSLPVELHL